MLFAVGCPKTLDDRTKPIIIYKQPEDRQSARLKTITTTSENYSGTKHVYLPNGGIKTGDSPGRSPFLGAQESRPNENPLQRTGRRNPAPKPTSSTPIPSQTLLHVAVSGKDIDRVRLLGSAGRMEKDKTCLKVGMEYTTSEQFTQRRISIPSIPSLDPTLPTYQQHIPTTYLSDEKIQPPQTIPPAPAHLILGTSTYLRSIHLSDEITEHV